MKGNSDSKIIDLMFKRNFFLLLSYVYIFFVSLYLLFSSVEINSFSLFLSVLGFTFPIQTFSYYDKKVIKRLSYFKNKKTKSNITKIY